MNHFKLWNLIRFCTLALYVHSFFFDHFIMINSFFINLIQFTFLHFLLNLILLEFLFPCLSKKATQENVFRE